MPTPHIEATKGHIAERILLPGDPLRAKFIADNLLESPVCYNKIRGILGYTGKYRGVPVSVQATGMGQPSMSIYATELFTQYGIKKAIRIGTAGALKKEIQLKSLVLAMSCCTDSALNLQYFNGFGYAPTASFALLNKAYNYAKEKELNCIVGSIVTSDIFYDEDERWRMWERYGVLAVEMESAALYTLAAKYKTQALSILTISDNVATGDTTSSLEREKGFLSMAELALETIIE